LAARTAQTGLYARRGWNFGALYPFSRYSSAAASGDVVTLGTADGLDTISIKFVGGGWPSYSGFPTNLATLAHF
jgi:hypothetical protein